uniref:DNA mismatch repair proteins mutS family domain-containing protein n=1 Tax=viral metagenome TaxID=1070528 RepID=A0A6C0KP09_9ZZZZ
MDSQLSQILSIQNPFTKEQVHEGFLQWPKTLKACLQRTTTFSSLKTRIQQMNPNKSLQTLQKLQAHVKDLEPLLRPSTNIEKEGYEQICFQGSPWSQLNFLPFILMFLSFYKSFIVPAFSVCLPFISILLPYIFLHTFYNIRIPFKEYMGLLWRMWNGSLQMPKSPEEFLNAHAAAAVPLAQPPAALQIKSLLQNAWTLFTIAQAIWHPVQQARHFMKLDTDCLKLGESIVGVKGCAAELWDQWKGWLPPWLGSWISLCPDDGRQAFAFVLESPFWLRHTFRAIGRFEILLHLAMRDDVVPAQFVRSDEPILMIKDFGDPSIPIQKRVVSSVKLGISGSGRARGIGSIGRGSHAIITGPNRGGKSSFLRGVLMNVVVAHSFGAVFAAAGQMTPFTWIADGMRLDDTPGEQSMFEREVAFGSAVLKKKGGAGLVLYDELFHSTNPPDAKRTSELFCDRLWKKKNCLSLVSTHVYSLAKEAPANIQRLCMGTWKQGDKYTFSYTVQKGICEVSSVDLLLKQFHLL